MDVSQRGELAADPPDGLGLPHIALAEEQLNTHTQLLSLSSVSGVYGQQVKQTRSSDGAVVCLFQLNVTQTSAIDLRPIFEEASVSPSLTFREISAACFLQFVTRKSEVFHSHFRGQIKVTDLSAQREAASILEGDMFILHKRWRSVLLGGSEVVRWTEDGK